MANGSNGHDQRGRFTVGNKAAVGRRTRHAERVGKLRDELLDAITPEAIRKAITALIREAESGNVAAIRELLDRAVGKPIEADLLERLESLETAIAERKP
ncbi:hypothetical protein HED60_19235 [Planctomycetales bacterium ZRK34]|nr:hypothetical protein HED60_19235 [Planctomycetales bacterium ZRK34]